MGQAVVLEVTGRLRDVVEDLDHAIELALAKGPRGVVCDLAAVLEGAEPGAVDVLAGLGRHVRDWPGIPVAVACPDPQVREVLAAHRLGGHLIVTASLLSAVSAALAAPAPAVVWLRLTPHPTAPRAWRDFVTRTLLDWRLGRVIRFASPVISELVQWSRPRSCRHRRRRLSRLEPGGPAAERSRLQSKLWASALLSSGPARPRA